MKYTIFHEITHAFIDSYGMLQIDWDDEIVSDFIANYIEEIMKKANEVWCEIYS